MFGGMCEKGLGVLLGYRPLRVRLDPQPHPRGADNGWDVDERPYRNTSIRPLSIHSGPPVLWLFRLPLALRSAGWDESIRSSRLLSVQGWSVAGRVRHDDDATYGVMLNLIKGFKRMSSSPSKSLQVCP